MSYYRRFIPRFSAIAQPLYSLTREDTPFLLSADCETAFDRLKGHLTQVPVLAYPQFGKGFLPETDVSGVGLGAVLSQKQEDGCRTLQPHKKNYGISEMEGLGVVWAVKHFRHYIYCHHCHHCIVYTDHEALKALLNTPQPSGKLARRYKSWTSRSNIGPVRPMPGQILCLGTRCHYCKTMLGRHSCNH